MNIQKKICFALVFVVLGIVIVWQYRSVDMNTRLAQEQLHSLESVKTRLLEQISNNQKLAQKREDISSKLDILERSHGNAESQRSLLESEIAQLKKIAGLEAVSGKGIIITVDRGDTPYSMVEDTDLLALVNELRICDAQAISINDERLTAMSEISKSEGFIVINGRQMLPPFVIKVVGDASKLHASMNIVDSVIEHLRLFIHIEVEEKEQVTVPALHSSDIIRTDLLQPAQ